MAHMSLGFVNDTHRGMKDTMQSSRQQSGARPRQQSQPMHAVPEDPPAAGVVPVIDGKPRPAPAAPPAAMPDAGAPALPKEAAAAQRGVQTPSSQNTLERRLEFVTGQVRELYDTVTHMQGANRSADGVVAQRFQQVHSRLEDVAQRAAHAADDAPGPLLTIRGACAAETPQFDDRSGSVGQPIAPIAKGTPLVLAYPMTETGPVSGGAVYMRRMNVDPDTAAVSWTWVQLYAHGEEERVFVSGFSP